MDAFPLSMIQSLLGGGGESSNPLAGILGSSGGSARTSSATSNGQVDFAAFLGAAARLAMQRSQECADCPIIQALGQVETVDQAEPDEAVLLAYSLRWILDALGLTPPGSAEDNQLPRLPETKETKETKGTEETKGTVDLPETKGTIPGLGLDVETKLAEEDPAGVVGVPALSENPDGPSRPPLFLPFASRGTTGGASMPNLQGLLLRMRGMQPNMASQLPDPSTLTQTPVLHGMPDPVSTLGKTPTGVDPSTVEPTVNALSSPQAGPASKPLLPDLVYISEARRDPSAGLVLTDNIRLVSAPQVSADEATAALQTLIDKVRIFESKLPAAAESTSMDPSIAHFVAGRAGMTTGSAPGAATPLGAAMALPTGADPAGMADGVAKVQAVLADMAARLEGNVALDPARLRAVMHLEPPALGRLHVQLQVDDAQRVTVNMQADQQATRDFLQQHQSDLRQGLTDQGFAEEEVELLFSDPDADVVRSPFEEWLGRQPRVA